MTERDPAEAGCELGGGFTEDARLVAAGGGAVDGGALHADEMVDGDGGEQRRLALSAGEQAEEFEFGLEAGAGEAALVRLRVEADLAAEGQKSAVGISTRH
jgi:hypothetical protein